MVAATADDPLAVRSLPCVRPPCVTSHSGRRCSPRSPRPGCIGFDKDRAGTGACPGWPARPGRVWPGL